MDITFLILFLPRTAAEANDAQSSKKYSLLESLQQSKNEERAESFIASIYPPSHQVPRKYPPFFST